MVDSTPRDSVLKGFPAVGIVLGLITGVMMIPISGALDDTESERYTWWIAFGIAGLITVVATVLAKRVPQQGLTLQGFAVGVSAGLIGVAALVYIVGPSLGS
jgi:hypothetical protein